LPVKAIVAVSAAGDLGTLPGPGFGGEVVIGALLGPLRVELAGTDWLSQDVTAAEPIAGATQGAHIHLLEGVLRGCIRGRLGSRFEVDPCLGAGIAYASSSGFDRPQTLSFRAYQNSGNWGVLRADLLAAWTIAGPLAVRAVVGLAVPTTLPDFVIEGPPAPSPPTTVFLHRAAQVDGRGALGVELRFP
jgi:hypothetical protein